MVSRIADAKVRLPNAYYDSFRTIRRIEQEKSVYKRWTEELSAFFVPSSSHCPSHSPFCI